MFKNRAGLVMVPKRPNQFLNYFVKTMNTITITMTTYYC